MSFAIREHGERKKLAEHIQTLKEMNGDKPAEDQSLMDGAKDIALKQLEKLNTKYGGATVIMEGKANENSRQVTVQVIGHEGHF